MNSPTNKFPSPEKRALARPLVSIVIVVWNAKKYVFECLSSLREQCGHLAVEVIVVDNASTDGSPEMISEIFPEFTLVRNSENLGFAKANNIGISKSCGHYVALVNSDVKFTSDCFSPMLEYFEQNQGVALLGPKMLGADGEIRRSTMRFPTIWNYLCRAFGLDAVFKKSRWFGGFLMADFDHKTTRRVEVLNGWFVMARRSALEHVGLLDPQFFMYGEDIDWSYRFRQAGEPVVFFAGAEAIHYGGASSSNAPIRFYLEMCRADWQLWRKHRGWLARVAFFVIFGIHHSVRLCVAAGAYLFRPSQRSSMLFKVKKSLACLRWLSETTTGNRVYLHNDALHN